MSWYFLLMILIFNVTDTIGRKLGGIINIPDISVLILSLARILFIPTTVMIALNDAPSDKAVGIWSQDWFKIMNICLFAFSNGYLSTQCSIKGPGMGEGEQRQ